MADVTIRVQALDGTWETLGVDRQAGVWPEGLELSADGWGGKSCTFDLRRDPSAVWPDISAFTPVEVDVEGQLAWSGRVSETPSRDGTDRVMSVVCEGWQHHLDDDLVQRLWVLQDLGQWRDSRTFPSVDLTKFRQPPLGNVQVGGGQIVLGFSQGTVPIDCSVGVTLDLGPSRAAKKIAVYGTVTGNNAAFSLAARGHDSFSSGYSWPGYTDAFGGTALTNAYHVGSFSGYKRYVTLFIYCNATTTLSADLSFQINTVTVFGEDAFESSTSSVLRASRVVSDVLDAATPLLSSDRSGVTATAFNMPEYAPDGPRTPREHVAAVNAFHGWLAKVDPDRRMIFGALPSRPRFTVGDWSAVELQDAAGNSGQDIYNRVLVTGQDPAGQPVQVSRTAVQAFGLPTIPQTDIVVSNPSFETNTAGWSSGDPLTRTTTAGEFDSAPAGLKFAASGGEGATTTLSGTARRGSTYILALRMRASVNMQLSVALTNAWTYNGVNGFAYPMLTTSWQTVTVSWTPPTNAASPQIVIWPGFQAGNIFIDSVTVSIAAATLPDRRRFRRTKQLQVSPTLPSDGVAAATLGDAWLAGHATTPFRGSLNITGPDAIRDRTSGQPVPPHQLLRDTGELIHLSDRVNPDTGGIGRDARITQVTYRPDQDQATITLDNTRSDLDALLSRLAVVQGAS